MDANEKEEKETGIIVKIKEAIKILNEIDDYANSLGDQLSVVDTKEQDLLHYIENNPISCKWTYRIVKEFKQLRVERRKIKNDMEIMSKFNEQKNKITSREWREFILAELHKKQKQLDTVYKNRQYTDEEMENLISGK